ncbi:MAG: FtsX-like permease family protein [Oscillospiraceae bacterium]|nr:FtsX-like permease family protein [Oscillospiraceae bacterium]
MKRTQIKDTVRNIRKQLVSFFSIIVIALLGVSIFLGLNYSSCAIARNGSEFFAQQHFRDIEMISTLLFTEEDLNVIRETEGVADVEPVWMVGAAASSGGDRVDVNVVSVTGRLNLPVLIEGRLPENGTECAVEQKLAEKMGWTVGSEIRLQNTAGSTVQYLNGERFVMTGVANHPDHSNTMVTDTFYILVTPDAFDREALDGCFMRAEIAVEGAGTDRFSETYKEITEAVRERLEALALSGPGRRDEEIHEQYSAEIEDRQRELDDGKKALEEGRAELDEGWAACAEGERELISADEELEEAARQLDDAKAELESAEKQLSEAKTTLEDGEARLKDAAGQLSAARRKLNNGWNELEDAKAQIRDGIRGAAERVLGDGAGLINWADRQTVDLDAGPATAMTLQITETYSFDMNLSLDSIAASFADSDAISDEVLLQIYEMRTGSQEGFDAAAERSALKAETVQAAAELEGKYHELHSACKQWDEGDRQFWDGLTLYYVNKREYRIGLEAYEEGLRQYEEGKARYEEGLASYEQGLLDVEEGRKKLEESKRQLEEGEKEYADGLARLSDGEEQIAAARERLDKLDPCRWLVMDMDGNAGYVQIKLGSNNLKSLESTFATLFVLVGALVIFATVSKMVDEQRTQVGTTKALGFFKREIFAKYLSFGAFASVLGAVLGVLAAYFVMEGIALGGYDDYSVIDLKRPAITPVPTLIVLLAAAALAVAAVWAACSQLLRTPAIRLMQPKVPAGAGKKGKNGKSPLSLYSRLILLNMKSDFKRVLVTIVSVAGCCALVVIGVTIKSALTRSLDRQFDDIVKYDWRVNFNPEESETAESEIRALLEEAGTDYTSLYFSNAAYQVEEIQAAELFCGDLEEIEDFYRLKDWKTGEDMEAPDKGILIQRRVAESYGLEEGEELEIALGGVKSATVTVEGIFEHYIGRPVFMSPSGFERSFGEKYEPNVFFVRLNGADAGRLEDALRSVRGFASITSADSGKAVFNASAGTINSLVAIFIFMAAVMAGVVLMNLTSIYVLQKKRELTIMRVNGFTVREVVAYMLRETALTTTMGILLGIAVGSAISYRICRLLEQPFLQCAREPSAVAWIAGAGLTLFFTALVNLIALRPVRNLKLTDVT